MGIFDFEKEKEIQKGLEELFEGKINKIKISKEELLAFLKKDEEEPKEAEIVASVEENKEEIEKEEVTLKEEPKVEEDQLKIIDDKNPIVIDRLLDEYEDQKTPTIAPTGNGLFPFAGGGENNEIANIGSGIGLYKDKYGPQLRLKTLLASGSITITDNGDDITFSSANISASNIINNSLVSGVYVDNALNNLNNRITNLNDSNIICTASGMDVPTPTVKDSLEYLHFEINELVLSAGSVASVFGRAGVIVATSGDYNSKLITHNGSNVSASLIAISANFNNYSLSGHNHDHAILTNLNSTNYQHLTSAQYNELTSGGNTELHYHNNAAGGTTIPVTSVTSAGKLNVGSITANLYPNDDFTGELKQYTISALTNYSLTPNVYYYVTVIYNNGNPIYDIILDNTLINHSNRLAVCQVIWEVLGSINESHIFCVGDYGLGLSNKLAHRLIHTQRFGWESGLALGESGTRNITCTNGTIWYDGEEIHLSASNTLANNYHFYYHTSGSWNSVLSASYNNTQYDNGTNLATVSVGRFAVNWVYRSVSETSLDIFVVLGTGNYKLTEAQVSQPPASLPTVISKQCILLGRIIVEAGSSTAYQIDSAFSVTFTPFGTVRHNDTTDIQGGDVNDYYHLTKLQRDILTSGGNADSLHTHTSLSNNISAISANLNNNYYTITQTNAISASLFNTISATSASLNNSIISANNNLSAYAQLNNSATFTTITVNNYKTAKRIITTTSTATSSDFHIIGNSTSAISVNLLPLSATGTGNQYRITNINTGDVTVNGSLIDGTSYKILRQWDSMTVEDITNNVWLII